MENWGEDWIWHVRIYSICWINCQNSMKSGKWRLILDMSSWDTLPMQGTSYLIVLILECAQNMDVGLGVGVGRLPSGEVNNFSRYIAESLHKAWGH